MTNKGATHEARRRLRHGPVKHRNEGEREVYALTRVVEKRIADRARTRGCGQERFGGWSAGSAFVDSDVEGGLLSSYTGEILGGFFGGEDTRGAAPTKTHTQPPKPCDVGASRTHPNLL